MLDTLAQKHVQDFRQIEYMIVLIFDPHANMFTQLNLIPESSAVIDHDHECTCVLSSPNSTWNSAFTPRAVRVVQISTRRRLVFV